MEQQSGLDSAYAWIKSHPAALDAWLAVACALVLVGGYAVSGGSGSGVVIGLGLTLPLAGRRIQPVLSAGAVALAGLAQIVLMSGLLPADAAALLSLYALAAFGPAWASRLGLGTGLVEASASVIRYLGHPLSLPGSTVAALGFATTLVFAAWLLGHLRRLSLQNEWRLAERARLLEVERDQQAQLAATAERARIARELHDVVAHSLSITIAQADGGRYAAAADPQAAVDALGTISTTARQALTDMRALLGVLRDGDARQFTPQPGIPAIPELVSQVAASGLDVRMQVHGYGQPLPPGPELAAYRIVQESLTNVLKHGGPSASALVELAWSPVGVTVTVSDSGRGAAASPAGDGAGQGVVGMRERVSLHGGTLEAGPARSGGYAVRAFLPYVRTS